MKKNRHGINPAQPLRPTESQHEPWATPICSPHSKGVSLLENTDNTFCTADLASECHPQVHPMNVTVTDCSPTVTLSRS